MEGETFKGEWEVPNELSYDNDFQWDPLRPWKNHSKLGMFNRGNVADGQDPNMCFHNSYVAMCHYLNRIEFEF